MKKQYLLAVLLTFIFVANAQAINLVKVSLGGDGPDMSFDGTTFETIDDGNGASLGDQQTNVLFVGFGGSFADIESDAASFLLHNVLASGATDVVGGVVVQGTQGGEFSLFAPDNTLLISGVLGSGALTGGLASSGTGSFFNTQLGMFTGGSLLSYLNGNTLDFSLALNNIVSTSGQGLYLDGDGLEPFNASGSALIQGTEVPEPASMMLLLSGLAGLHYRRKQAKQAQL